MTAALARLAVSCRCKSVTLIWKWLRRAHPARELASIREMLRCEERGVGAIAVELEKALSTRGESKWARVQLPAATDPVPIAPPTQEIPAGRGIKVT